MFLPTAAYALINKHIRAYVYLFVSEFDPCVRVYVCDSVRVYVCACIPVPDSCANLPRHGDPLDSRSGDPCREIFFRLTRNYVLDLKLDNFVFVTDVWKNSDN